MFIRFIREVCSQDINNNHSPKCYFEVIRNEKLLFYYSLRFFLLQETDREWDLPPTTTGARFNTQSFPANKPANDMQMRFKLKKFCCSSAVSSFGLVGWSRKSFLGGVIFT